jgi:hypothetical protein
MATKKEPAARLTVVVEYNALPDLDDVRQVLEEARHYGDVKTAQFEILMPAVQDLTRG